MSKIFEALHRGQNQVESLLPPLNLNVDPKPAEQVAQVGCVEMESGPADTHAETPQRYRRQSLHVASTSPVLPFDSPGAASEQYRVLRTKIVQHINRPKVLLVSSAGPGDGKSTTAVNLAGVLSLKNDGDILIVDGDFRRPALKQHLGLPDGPGLANVLAGSATLEDAIVQAEEYPRLYLMQAGEPDRNPTELLDSSTWHEVIARLRKVFSYIVVDSPPIAAVADYDLLMTASDGVIVVVRPDHTKRQVCSKALAAIPSGKCLGVVLNCVPDWFLARHQGYSPYSPSYYYY